MQHIIWIVGLLTKKQLLFSCRHSELPLYMQISLIPNCLTVIYGVLSDCFLLLNTPIRNQIICLITPLLSYSLSVRHSLLSIRLLNCKSTSCLPLYYMPCSVCSSFSAVDTPDWLQVNVLFNPLLCAMLCLLVILCCQYICWITNKRLVCHSTVYHALSDCHSLSSIHLLDCKSNS